jgi:isoleucyl-tRNA synthetase
MPFDKVDTQVDFPAQERAILQFWDRIAAFEKLRAKNRGRPKWSFLDGPITANNPMGVHHAWGRTYKDAYQRYFAMTGHELRYQNGFDCQGLWVEVEVEKELELGSKRDIENLEAGNRFASINRFVQLCKERVDTFARIQTNQSIRLGYWMDWDRSDEDWAKPPDERKSYFTMSEENNYTIWSFLKKCHQRGFVYKAYDSMPWCPRCGVGISQMEMHEGYKLVAHRSIFLRFPLKDRPNENLLVWTTTPWTLTSNVGAAVNPELTYLKVKQAGQIYYVAKGAFKHPRLEEQFKAKEWVDGVPKLSTLEQIFKSRSKEGYEIVGEVKGAEMVGWAYDGPFDEFEAQQHEYGYPAELAEVVRKQGWAPAVSARQAHRVVAWKDVGETEGTGIVHIAPGCGKEDFALGKETGLPPVAPLDEDGVFLPGFGSLSGKSALSKDVVEFVVNSLKEKGLLFATELYPHNYPHCWRCKTELLYRLVDEWYINMAWRDEIKEIVKKAVWLPESINGAARELDWLTNMGDWMISKKRYWGLALPIWVDEKTGEFEAIGSRQELKERAVEGWQEFDGHTPHRPWIDKVKIRNPRTGNLMSRIPDVGNPWLDAGIVPYSTLRYNTDRKYWKEWFPAAFVTEGFPGQFRNWFYAMLAMSAMMNHKTEMGGLPPFKTLLGHASVRDQFGEEMHKSAGNAIEFNGAADSGYTIDHELKPKEQPKAPEGALSFEVIEKDKRTEKGFEKVRAVRASYPPMGSDVIRWLYCRQNPAANLNFGPLTADEVRAKFVLKLWNCYAFFCNYARIDGFDPSQPLVPRGKRPDIDLWILSDLQLLIRKAHDAFKTFDVMAFCLEAEKFVDDKLSNWYVRRSRRRFWKSEQGADKLAAYQTLYAVLTTLTRLFAPVIPFLTETMWQNLRNEEDPQSVHLCDYPIPEPAVERPDLSAWMEEVLYLVSIGSSARNAAKIKVRQPLAEIRYLFSDPKRSQNQMNALGLFGDQIKEELNLKRIPSSHDFVKHGQLLRAQVQLNIKSAAPKLGSRLKEAQSYLASLSPEQHDLMAGAIPGSSLYPLPLPSGEVSLESADFLITYKAPAGWAGVADRGTQVMVDTRITPELARDGKARDIVRHVQDLRKKANLEMEDRIALYLGTDSPELHEAIDAHRDYIAAETLTTRWLTQPPAGGEIATVKIDGQALTIALQRA